MVPRIAGSRGVGDPRQQFRMGCTPRMRCQVPAQLGEAAHQVSDVLPLAVRDLAEDLRGPGRSSHRGQSRQLEISMRMVQFCSQPAIQLGDGGWGVDVEVTGYHRLFHERVFGYVSGFYLFNPRNTNGVSTFRTRRGEELFSVTDQYLYRGGISRALPGVRGVTVTFGGRIEGVPVRDAIGKSEGFRRPGYAISLDPGFMYARGSYVFSCNVPFAVQRNRRKSVSDYMNGVHGDAARGQGFAGAEPHELDRDRDNLALRGAHGHEPARPRLASAEQRTHE